MRPNPWVATHSCPACADSVRSRHRWCNCAHDPYEAGHWDRETSKGSRTFPCPCPHWLGNCRFHATIAVRRTPIRLGDNRFAWMLFKPGNKKTAKDTSARPLLKILCQGLNEKSSPQAAFFITTAGGTLSRPGNRPASVPFRVP